MNMNCCWQPARGLLFSLRLGLVTFLGVSLFLQPAVAQQTDEIIDRMIAAHGGFAEWGDAHTVSFTDEFRPGDAK